MKWKLCSCCVTRGEREIEAGAAFAADEVLITKAGSIVCFKARLPRIKSIFHHFSAHLPTHWFGSCVQVLHRQMRNSDIIIICCLFCLSFGNSIGEHAHVVMIMVSEPKHLPLPPAFFAPVYGSGSATGEVITITGCTRVFSWLWGSLRLVNVAAKDAKFCSLCAELFFEREICFESTLLMAGLMS